ncbi:MAG: hypothetical protein O7D86_10855 [Proteobacteria bacterium]|nr:hypothetical protein [Pseudomonadota bacterium]
MDNELENAQQIAYQSMVYAADLGHIISFQDMSLGCYSISVLLKHLYNTIQQFELDGYIVSYDGNQPDKMCPDLTEEQLEDINRARWEERIITEGPKFRTQ